MMAKAKKTNKKEKPLKIEGSFDDVINLSAQPLKSKEARTEFEFEFDGTVFFIQVLKDINGNPKYLFNDESGGTLPFSWSPYLEKEDGQITPEQRRILEKFKKENLTE